MQGSILGGRNYFLLSLAIQRKFKEALHRKYMSHWMSLLSHQLILAPE